MQLQLLVEGLAVAIVVMGPKGRVRFDGLGVQFVIIAALYHGLTESVQQIFPDANQYRNYVNDEDLSSWLWIAAGSLLAFSCAYVVSSRLSARSRKRVASGAVSLLTPWFWLAVTVPIYFVSVLGTSGVDSYWTVGLAQQFVLLCMVLTSVACVQAGASVVVTIAIQTVAASLLASRLNVIASAIMLLTALYSAGVRIRLRDALSLTILLLLVVPTISLARAAVGREQLLGGVADRADGIVKGGRSLATGSGAADLIDDFVYRFDGNTFPAMIDRKFAGGHAPAGIWPLVNDVWVAVPAFLNPSKSETDVTRRNDAAYVIAWFGLPEGASFVPMQLGILYGSTGVVLFPFVLALCGALAEGLDRRLGRLSSADGLVLKVALCQANVFMEVGFIAYPIALRGALVVMVVTRLVTALTSANPFRPRATTRAGVGLREKAARS